jgi:hypothetical protein
VIVELIMLFLIKVQASDLVMIPSSSPLQAPFPHDHLVKKGKKNATFSFRQLHSYCICQLFQQTYP